MWGQEVFCCHQHECHRIIPTRVGTRYWWWHYTTTIKDHPHACGDKFTSTVKLTEHTGSSPRVWGQARNTEYPTHNGRIIPTRVGTSAIVYRCEKLLINHPHACGDKCRFRRKIHNFLGSSPRVWGQDIGGGTIPPPLRIIPTRVGTSCLVRRRVGR